MLLISCCVGDVEPKTWVAMERECLIRIVEWGKKKKKPKKKKKKKKKHTPPVWPIGQLPSLKTLSFRNPRTVEFKKWLGSRPGNQITRLQR